MGGFLHSFLKLKYYKKSRDFFTTFLYFQLGALFNSFKFLQDNSIVELVHIKSELLDKCRITIMNFS
ncbi:hypothetical protein BLD25_04610 [Candidatus Gracilibacteria bacterium GN02-872]|nr:hypothetical protein BLD25_04610 [Candidatus Gracilibacteria bacterium GN02-872]